MGKIKNAVISGLYLQIDLMSSMSSNPTNVGLILQLEQPHQYLNISFLLLSGLLPQIQYSAGRNRKYIGFSVPLTRIRMLYHQSKLGQEQLFLGMSLGPAPLCFAPFRTALGTSLGKAVPALALTGGILHTAALGKLYKCFFPISRALALALQNKNISVFIYIRAANRNGRVSCSCEWRNYWCWRRKKYGNCKAVQDSNWKSLLTSDPKLLLV